MPQRPPTLAQRLRSAWAVHTHTHTRAAADAPARHARDYKGSAFADRLRAAVAARH